MDEYLSDIYTAIFKKWILNNTYELCKLSYSDDTIYIETDYCLGEVIFNSMNIIELKITNKITNNNEFYLHFRLFNINHAVGLFKEFYHCIEKVNKRKKIRVLLMCSSGLTTSYYASLLNNAASVLNVNIEFDAKSFQNFNEVIALYDFIFLAPQISFELSKIKNITTNKPISVIPAKIFASYDTKWMIDNVIARISHNKANNNLGFKNSNKIGKILLVLSVFRDKRRIHIKYRLYDLKGQVLLENEIMKLLISIDDIYDVINSITILYPDINDIGISIPGFINEDGLLMSTTLNGLDNFYIMKMLKSNCNKNYHIFNDANSGVAGYYYREQKYHNLAFIFQPVNYNPGVGIIVNDQLINGFHNLAGEIQYSTLTFKDDIIKYKSSKEGIVEMLASYCLNIISVIDPEVLVFYTELIDNLDPVYQKIKSVLPKNIKPNLILIKDINEYIIEGVYYLLQQNIINEK